MFKHLQPQVLYNIVHVSATLNSNSWAWLSVFLETNFLGKVGKATLSLPLQGSLQYIIQVRSDMLVVLNSSIPTGAISVESAPPSVHNRQPIIWQVCKLHPPEHAHPSSSHILLGLSVAAKDVRQAQTRHNAQSLRSSVTSQTSYDTTPHSV